MAKKTDVRTDIVASDKTGKAYKSAQDNMRNLASSAAILEGPLGKVAGRINALGAALGRMNPLSIAGGVAISSLLVGTKLAVSAAADLEEQMARLNAVITVTGRASEISAEQVNILARELGEATLTSAEAARDAAAAVLTFENIRTKDLEHVLSLAQDLSVVMGGGLTQNAIKLARALDNPREGLSGLSRNILATSPAWREMVADMADAGDQAAVAAEIFGRLDAKIGGVGGAGGGLTFAIDTLDERWTRLLQNLGGTATVTTSVTAAAKDLSLLNTFLETNMTTADLLGEVVEGTAENIIGFAQSLGLISEETERLQKAKIKDLFVGFIPDETFTDLQTITWALTQQSQEVGRLTERQERAQKVGAQAHADYNARAQSIIGLTSSINALVDAQISLTTETKKGLGVDFIATELDAAGAQIDKFTKQAQSKRDRAEVAFLAMRDRLIVIGAEGQVKLQELQTAYSGFLFKLDSDDSDKAQKKADKAVLIEENKLARLQQVLIQQRALGTDVPGEVRNLPAEQEDARYQLLLDGLARRKAALLQSGLEEAEAYGIIQAEKTVIDQTHAEKRRQIAETSAAARRGLEQSVVSNAVSLLGVLGQKSKAAAAAALLITKGIAIANVLMRAQEAAVLAYSSQLIPGVPSTYGTAATAYTSTISLGNASAGIIAATGLAQAASIGGGAPSGGGGGGGGSGIASRDITPLADPTSSQQIIINNYGAITSEDFTELVAGALQAGSDADIITLEVQGEVVEVRTV